MLMTTPDPYSCRHCNVLLQFSAWFWMFT